jgi:hypothetical protein
VSRVFAPFGFYQEIQLTGIDRLAEAPEDARLIEPINKNLSGMAFSARLRNYWDLSQSTNIELSASGITGRVEHPIGYEAPNSPNGFFGDGFLDTPVNAISARQTVAGVDFTFRWRPLQQGLYKSFIFQAEAMQQFNQGNSIVPDCAELGLDLTECGRTFDAGPSGNPLGGYAFARVQISQRAYLGARFDYVGESASSGTTKAGSGYLEWFPSEFSKLVAGYERYVPSGFDMPALNRILLQASFALGPHKPHPF